MMHAEQCVHCTMSGSNVLFFLCDLSVRSFLFGDSLELPEKLVFYASAVGFRPPVTMLGLSIAFALSGLFKSMYRSFRESADAIRSDHHPSVYPCMQPSIHRCIHACIRLCVQASSIKPPMQSSVSLPPSPFYSLIHPSIYPSSMYRAFLFI